MSDYYEVQAAESRPAAAAHVSLLQLSSRVVCLKPSKRLRQAARAPPASLSRVSCLARGVAAAPTMTDSGKEGGRVAIELMPARQVQRTVACVRRGLSERESTIVTIALVFQCVGGPSVVYQISLEERSVAQRKNVGYDPNCCMTHQKYSTYQWASLLLPS